ncbi:MAG: restriction endonuclease subunit S [Agathobacter sp.]|nr:restriction endonuclease subunit S [Agathobacter sp.]
MSKLHKYAFSDLYDMTSGISSTKEQAGHGAPFVSFSTVFNNYFLPDELTDLMDTSEREQETYSIRKGDILITRTSETVDELAMSCVALKDYPKATYSGFVKRLRPKTTGIAYDKYMGFFLRSKYFRKVINSNTIMTLRASFNEDIFSFLTLYLPDYEEQVKIGDMLYYLEKKIQINKKINDNLQQMTKIIYDYWFTQFDFPNKDGKPYRSSGGSMMWDDNLKKEIPQGWASGQLSDIANITMGQSPEGSTYNEEQNGTVFFQGCTDFGNRFPEPRVYTTAPTRFAKAGDILMSVRAPVGTLNVALENCCIGRGLAALNSKYGSQLHLMYTLVMFKRLFNIMDSNGTTFGSITKDELYEMKVVIPPAEQMEAFERTVQPIEQKIKQCELENRELTRQRNWLLPMLMNGQATVSD